MQQWEYKIHVSFSVTVDQDDLLNRLGQEGWELVSVFTKTTASGYTKITFYFKRPKQ